MAREEERPRIFIIGGALSADNRGIAAISACTAKILREHIPDSQLTLWHAFPESYARTRPTATATDVEVVRDASAWAHFAKLPVRVILALFWRLVRVVDRAGRLQPRDPVLRAILSSQVAVSLNFGDGLCDTYGPLRLVSLLAQNGLPLLLGKPLVLFPQSIGEFRPFLTRTLARAVLSRARVVLARETITRRYLDEMRVRGPDIRLVPDTAFLLEAVSRDEAERILESEGLSAVPSPREPRIGVSLNPYLGRFTRERRQAVRYPEMAARFLDHLVDRTGGMVLVVPHVTLSGGADPRAFAQSLRERSKHRGRILVLRGEHTAEQLKGVIGTCDVFVGTLAHTIIAALSIGVPSMAIAYSHKMAGILGSVGMEKFVVPFQTMDLPALQATAEQLWTQRFVIRKALPAMIRSHEEAVRQSGVWVKEILEAPGLNGSTRRRVGPAASS